MKIKYKIANYYAGIGGNRKFWNDDDFEITAIENDPKIAAVYQKLYPNDIVIIADAHEHLLKNYMTYDFIWSSPPCQTHSKMNLATRHNSIRYVDGKLFEEIIFLQTYFKGKWVVENVYPYYQVFSNPTKIGRHLFWSNFHIDFIEIKQPKGFIQKSNLQGKKEMMDWLDIHFDETIYCGNNHCPVQILRNCVHPKVGLHILNCALDKKTISYLK